MKLPLFFFFCKFLSPFSLRKMKKVLFLLFSREYSKRKLAISHISLYFPHRTHIHPTEFFACEGNFLCYDMEDSRYFRQSFVLGVLKLCHS